MPGRTESKQLTKAKREKLQIELYTIAGIGSKKADALIEEGVHKLSDLKKPKIYETLSTETQTFITYKPLRLIPRGYIDKLNAVFSTFGDDMYIITGSYRRECKTCRDIDIIVDNIDNFLCDLRKVGGKPVIYNKGTDKSSMVLPLNSVVSSLPKKYVKIDVFSSNQEVYPFMVLYTTGNRIFNISMRAYAKRKGYLLNNYGLYPIKNGVVSTKSVRVSSELDIFNSLGLKYLSPTQRTFSKFIWLAKKEDV